MQKKLRFLITIAYWGVFGILILLLFRYVVPVILPFLLGLGVASLFHPLITKISRYRQRWFASAVLIFPFWGVLLFLLWKAGAMVYREALELLEWLQTVNYDEIFSSLKLPFLEGETGQWLLERADNFLPALLDISQGAVRKLLSVLMALPDAFVFCFAMVFSSYLFSLSYPKIEPFLLRQLPMRLQTEYYDIKDFLLRKILRIVRAYGIMFCINYAELLIGFWFLKVPYPLILAALIAFSDLFPYIGIVSVLVPWGIIEILVLSNPTYGAGLIVLAVIISVIRQFLEPRIVGKTIGLSALATVFSVYVGLKFLGFPGLIIAPLLALFLKEWNESGRLILWKTDPD